MGRARGILVLGAGVAVWGAACSVAQTPADEASVGTTQSQAAPSEPAGTPDSGDQEQTGMDPERIGQSVLDRWVAVAVADLQQRLGVEAATIAVVSADARVWSDASLGCPQPGMRYLQVPQEGALVVLSAAGREYRYHAGGRGREPFLCERPAPGERASVSPTPDPRLTPRTTPPGTPDG